MCGFFCILEIDGKAADFRKTALKQARLLRHRGPDWSGVWQDDSAVLAHERLAIVDVEAGAQPLVAPNGEQVLAVNGEIYNHRELRKSFPDYPFTTGSDCEVILPLYRELGPQFLNQLNGIFAFVLHDPANNDWLVARDPMGVIPLYHGRDRHGRLYVASELKALHGVCDAVNEFPPGHYWSAKMEAPERYYQPDWREFDAVTGGPEDSASLRKALEAAVHRQLMADVPYGVLLSGGLDSSVIAAITARYAPKRVEDDDRSGAWFPRLHTFSIGLADSPDLKAAKEVADHIGSVHHGFHFTLQEGLDALADVIWHLETYDVTTVRASTPMYLMARKIRAMGIKMVLSGEGADEIFGGYLYFHKAPNAREFHEETVRKLDALHQFDCLRANKAMSAFGVEARVPFLDRAFIDVAMKLNPECKRPGEGKIEKHILREATKDLLPEHILWRQKEQFSDGVGYGWIDALKDFADSEVSDNQMRFAAEHFPVNPPQSKEAYLYRSLFASHFPGEQVARLVPGGPSVACSTARAIEWDAAFKNNADPSGRAVRDVHGAAQGDL